MDRKREFRGGLNFGLVARFTLSPFVLWIASRLWDYHSWFLLSDAFLHHGIVSGVGLAFQRSICTKSLEHKVKFL